MWQKCISHHEPTASLPPLAKHRLKWLCSKELKYFFCFNTDRKKNIMKACRWKHLHIFYMFRPTCIFAWGPPFQVQASLMSFSSGLGHKSVNESLKSERWCQVPWNPQEPTHVRLERFEFPKQHPLQVFNFHRQRGIHVPLSKPRPFTNATIPCTWSETVLSGSC